jgi:integrase/recombinase XerD
MNKRTNTPALTPSGQQALDRFAQQVRECEDLRPATVRNYLSDLRHFIAWCEERWQSDDSTEVSADERADQTPVTFAPQSVTTPTLTAYRAFLQSTLGLTTLAYSLA